MPKGGYLHSVRLAYSFRQMHRWEEQSCWHCHGRSRPAKLPLPGVKAGEVNFVFTGLGTGKVAKHQKAPMNVRWINLNTGKVGLTKLGYNGINPDYPATVNGAAKTGRGTVLALLEGGVTTYEKESGNTHCSFLPTAAMINVR